MTSPFGRSKLSIGEDILLFKDEDDVQGTLKSNQARVLELQLEKQVDSDEISKLKLENQQLNEKLVVK